MRNVAQRCDFCTVRVLYDLRLSGCLFCHRCCSGWCSGCCSSVSTCLTPCDSSHQPMSFPSLDHAYDTLPAYPTSTSKPFECFTCLYLRLNKYPYNIDTRITAAECASTSQCRLVAASAHKVAAVAATASGPRDFASWSLWSFRGKGEADLVLNT